MHTSLLSCVSRTATPASTLPTVKEISILKVCGADFLVNSEIRCDNFELADATWKAWAAKAADWLGEQGCKIGETEQSLDGRQSQGQSMKSQLWRFYFMIEKSGDQNLMVLDTGNLYGVSGVVGAFPGFFFQYNGLFAPSSF